jgi:hypothetical protein
MSIANLRTKWWYRAFESLLGFTSLGFLLILIILVIVNPTILAIFLIIYSFLMVLKGGMHAIYSIYTYKMLLRWESVDWVKILDLMEKKPDEAESFIHDLGISYKSKIDWNSKIQDDLKIYKSIANTKFASPKEILQIPLFSIYDEASEVLLRSLKAIYDSKYPLDKIVVFISQEARVGDENNQKTFADVQAENWINSYNNLSETDLDIVYGDHTEDLTAKSESNNKFKDIQILKDKLNVVFTQHPDGLVGEIKGKASNEDWGARQASLFMKVKNLDPEMALITSLDSDSKVGENFFQMLSFRFCLTPDRLQAGFQPLPIYTNNFFTAHLFPRLVATNTTLWHMILYSLLDELHFFANYSVPVTVLQKVNFWVREVIAEDNLLFINCLVKFHGKFRVVPFYATFEGDAVYGEDYVESIINQYKQLQRWAWGGVEGIPYKFYYFFIHKDRDKTDLRKRLQTIFQEFSNHFFWATSPIVFTWIVVLPQILSTSDFRESIVSLNLLTFSEYFAWLSFLFLFVFSYITFKYIAHKATKNFQPKPHHWLAIAMQWILSPFIFILWGPPAIDAQLRGILGKYLGYWVTPKK